MKVTYEVIGMRKEFVVHEDEDMEFNPVYESRPIYTIFAKPTDSKMNYILAIQLDEFHRPCGSGYCMSWYGYMAVNNVYNLLDIGPLTHEPKRKTLFDALYDDDGGIINLTGLDDDPEGWENFGGVFRYSYDGGDQYYPRGGVSVDETLFNPLQRYSGRRMVWIFVGESGTGKSTIAMQYPYGVFETDAYDKLPDQIYNNVVVVGNRNHYDVLADILPRIYQEDKPKMIITDFYVL